jgi:MarR family transcriptional regulator, lower aerobic nicotinate degradation pathway regulator
MRSPNADWQRAITPCWQCSTIVRRSRSAIWRKTLGLDRSYVVGPIDQLEDAGLVQRCPDIVDRRRHTLTLTAQGRCVASACRAVSNQVEEELLAPLGPQDRSLLHALLHRVAAFHDARIMAD